MSDGQKQSQDTPRFAFPTPEELAAGLREKMRKHRRWLRSILAEWGVAIDDGLLGWNATRKAVQTW